MRLERLLILLNKNWRERLKAFVNELEKYYPKITIILFGSRARGDYSASSDTDLLVILEKYSWNDLKFILDLAYKHDVVSPELHIFSIKDVMRNFETNTVLIDAVYEGIVLIDKFNITNELQKRLKRILSKFKKTKNGWIPKDS